MSYFILEILLYYSTHVLGFLENATTQYKHGPYMGEGAKICFLFSSLIHNSILRGQYHYILLPLYRSCVYIKMCMFFHVYLYGDVINQVKHFKTDTSKIIETIIE
jgi:hypothetical protein